VLRNKHAKKKKGNWWKLTGKAENRK
jgi:hypothetical protein